MDIKFYPNPVVGVLTIVRTASDLTYLQVLSPLGTKAIERVWEKGAMTTQLDLSYLNPGIYFLNLSDDNSNSQTVK